MLSTFATWSSAGYRLVCLGIWSFGCVAYPTKGLNNDKLHPFSIHVADLCSIGRWAHQPINPYWMDVSDREYAYGGYFDWAAYVCRSPGWNWLARPYLPMLLSFATSVLFSDNSSTDEFRFNFVYKIPPRLWVISHWCSKNPSKLGEHICLHVNKSVYISKTALGANRKWGRWWSCDWWIIWVNQSKLLDRISRSFQSTNPRGFPSQAGSIFDLLRFVSLYVVASSLPKRDVPFPRGQFVPRRCQG